MVNKFAYIATAFLVSALAASTVLAAPLYEYTFENDGASAGQVSTATQDSGSTGLVLTTSLLTPNLVPPGANNPTYSADVPTGGGTLSMDFDGDWDILEATEPDTGSIGIFDNDRSWQVDFKITGSQPAGRGYLLSERKHGTGTWQSPGLQIYYDTNGTMMAYLAGRGGGWKYLAGGSIPVAVNQWHTVRVQWTANTKYLELYLDGVKDTGFDSLENAAETFDSCAGADISLTLGANAYWDGTNEIYTNHLKGRLDNVQIVPEPASAMFLLIGGLGLLRRRSA